MTTEKGGRPTDYNLELATEICETIATTSKGLATLCRENSHWPDRRTLLRWRLSNKEFCHLYEKAKVDQVELLVDECVDIADNVDKDDILNEKGDYVCNSEYVNRSRLRLDTRKWIASKLAPRLYGDKTNHSHDVTVRQEDAIKELA